MNSTKHRRTQHFNIVLFGVSVAALLVTLAIIFPTAFSQATKKSSEWIPLMAESTRVTLTPPIWGEAVSELLFFSPALESV